MRKLFFLFVVSLSITLTSAQEKKEGWTTKGNFKLLFNQSAFSDWTSKGENTLASNASINYNFDYVKGDYSWKNNITT